MSQPKALRGTFDFRVDQTPAPTGVLAGVGSYTLFPDALIYISFTGEVLLPPGKWDVGIVQNSWNDRVTNVYSEGGEFYFSQDTSPLLDLAPGMTDIWLNTLGKGVTSFENTSGIDKRFSVSLEAGDTPNSPPIPHIMTRGMGTITEHLLFAERVLQLIAALVARNRDTLEIYPLAATAGQPYGFMWRLEPSLGAPIFKFKPLFPTAIEMSPPFSLFGPSGVVTARPTANERGVMQAAIAMATYLADYGHRPPRKGDENLWL